MSKPTLIMKGLSYLKGWKKKPQFNPYWVTDCTYDVKFKYSYDEKTKTKIRQTQGC
jgi:hypothetical protein